MHLPDWLAPLRAAPALAGRVAWLDAPARAEATGVLRQRYAGGPVLGVVWSGETWAAARDDAARLQVVAHGPSGRDRQGNPRTSLLATDGAALWFTPDSELPPFLWIRVAPDPDDVAAILDDWSPAPWLRRVEFPRVVRGFLGFLGELRVPNPYDGGLVLPYPHDLQRHWAFSPAADAFSWGSAFPEDPWPEDLAGERDIDLVLRTRQYIRQDEGGICSFTRRTLHSGAWLTMELHRSQLWIAELRYRPGLSRDAVRVLNERFGTGLPEDLPVDLAAALLGFGWLDAPALEAVYAERPADPVAGLWGLAALHCHDLPRLVEVVTRRIDDPDLPVRTAFVETAAAYNLGFLLADRVAHEPDPDLRAFCEEAATKGLAAPDYTDQGEPVDLYEGDP